MDALETQQIRSLFRLLNVWKSSTPKKGENLSTIKTSTIQTLCGKTGEGVGGGSGDFSFIYVNIDM